METIINNLQDAIINNGEQVLQLDIKKEAVNFCGEKYQIRIEPGPLEMLTTGRWDATSQLIAQEDSIKATMKRLPYLNSFKIIK